MRVDEVPVYQTHAYLTDLLKKEGEPNRDMFTTGGLRQGKDGVWEAVWYAVSKWSAGQAWVMEFTNMIDCLVWLVNDEWSCELERPEAVDKLMEELWDAFADVPVNQKTEYIEEPFLHFAAGTPKEEIWHWFDRNYSKGVHSLLYGDADDSEEAERKRKFLNAVAEFYAEPDEEDKTVYVCYLIVDVENCGIHTEEMQVLRSIGDVAQWWLDQESALEDQAMFPIEQDTLSWMDVISKLKSGSNELNKAMYEWINDKDYDPLNCVQIIVEKHEIK